MEGRTIRPAMVRTIGPPKFVIREGDSMEVKREWFEKDYYASLESHLTLLKNTFKSV